MKKEYVSIQPEYVKKFQCDSSQCDDSCCHRAWHINIDSATYEKYKRLRNSPLKTKILSSIKYNKQHKFQEFKLKDDYRCPHLRSDNLCQIQYHLGEEYLSSTCATYPRAYKKINGCIIQALCMSCPIAAKLALLNTNPMTFEKVSLKIDLGQSDFTTIDIEQLATENPLFHHLIDIQMFLITILQNREFNIKDRLILIGFFLAKAEEVQQRYELQQIPSLIEAFAELISKKDLNALIKSFENDPRETLQFQLRLMDHLFNDGIAEFIKPYRDILIDTLGLSEENSISTLTKLYQQKKETYYMPFIAEHEYILENYLINEIFQNCFPFTLKIPVTQNYILFIAFFSMLEFLSVALAAHHKENMSTEHFIKIISQFTRLKASFPYMLALNKHIEEQSFDIKRIIETCLK